MAIRWHMATATAAICLIGASGRAEPMPVDKAARLFGARPDVYSASLSPDGKKIVMIVSGNTRARVAEVIDLANPKPNAITYSDNNMRLTHCGWASNDRIVCGFQEIAISQGRRLGFSRMIAIDSDGKNMKDLSSKSAGDALRTSQFSGDIVDWLDGTSPEVLMMRDHVPAANTGRLTASTADGYGVDRVNTRTLRAIAVERAYPNAGSFLADGQGHIRMMSLKGMDNAGLLNGWYDYRYRLTGDQHWRPFSRVNYDGKSDALRPVAVDGTANLAYALKRLNGREALYRVTLDETLSTELAYADPTVDVDDVVTIGRRGRVIGVSYVTDRRVTRYFDPAYSKLAESLSKVLPNLPIVTFESASADEAVLLLRASSDSDGGHLFIFDKATHHLTELAPVRPELEGVATATVKSITYPAGDGANIPAYLTLPPGSSGRGLPAIVMPHGGPAARDEWGFDWLAQFFAARGYAVIQPEFRGSSGFGDAWFRDNGFRSWKIAIRDVTAAGEWLVRQGIADPSKLAILGWSYGGYAALQSNVIDPGLFKAVVAIAPVTDLRALKTEVEGFTNAAIVRAYIGDGAHLTEGSPALHAAQFQAPVLMFHGETDMNVAVAESEAMNGALKRAGKQSELIRYPGLDHQIDDTAARIDMLTKADAFLRSSMHM
ncbi:alpha/beta hydrolase family protein [Sphingomonas bacterium]|uniref:alpha/beta hydrolase family protein n=1 Tax=Sphingomonas bacterium TaxID=1895847 RepID=UPI0020C64555|nr:S9 family peptidase [Sphingomonas bacterium]